MVAGSGECLMHAVTYCIIADDGTNCGDRHIPCLATKDQDEHHDLIQVLHDDGHVELDYGPNWTPSSGVWLAHKQARWPKQ